MGVYDLRCALSGLSLTGGTGPGSFRVAALLVGEVDGRWAPLLPPVGGHYDRYGRVELWGDDAAQAAHAAFVGAALELLWQAGALRTDAPAALARCMASGEFGDGAGPFLAHIADSVQGGYRVWIGSTQVWPCFYREDVAAEIAADESLASAPTVHLPLLDAFAPLPSVTVEVLARLGRILRWAERHGGLVPISIDDGCQHWSEHFDRFAREAHARDPILRRLLGRWLAADIAAQDARRELLEPRREPPAPAFTPAMVDPVLAAAGVPAGERASLVAAVLAAADPAAVARILAAARSQAPASLAEFDGTIELRGDRIAVCNPEYPRYPALYRIDGRALRVREGEQVAAGDRLTDGDVEPHDLLRIFGAAFVAARLSEALGGLLGLPAGRARTLVEPMLRHGQVCDTGERVSLARWAAWAEEDGLDGLRAELSLTGYPALLTHTDPTLAAIREAQERRHRLAQLLDDPDRYYLPRDLADGPAADRPTT